MEAELASLRRLLADSQPQTPIAYIRHCDVLSRDIEIVSDPGSTTQGDATDPVKRIYPRRIVPLERPLSDDIWDCLRSDPSFLEDCCYPSKHQLDYVRFNLRPVSSEDDLRDFFRETIVNPIELLVGRIYENSSLRKRLRLKGTLSIKSHTNLGRADRDSLQDSEDASAGPGVLGQRSLHKKADGTYKTRGKGSRADYFGIRTSDADRRIACQVFELKPPHKWSIQDILTGLKSEIRPDEDIFGRDDTGYDFECKVRAAAVVTQVFSYMINKGVCFGVICTGEAFICLENQQDPANVFFHVFESKSKPQDDGNFDPKDTAVGYILAFVLRTLAADEPPLSWHDDAQTLDLWPMEHYDPLKIDPQSARKEPRLSPYYGRQQRFDRTPIRTRSKSIRTRSKSCCEPETKRPRPEDDDDDDEPSDNAVSPSPAVPGEGGRSSTLNASTSVMSESSGSKRRGKRAAHGRQDQVDILSRPYCTHRCLQGLARGEPLDKACPNIKSHGQNHLPIGQFRSLLRHQLMTKRDENANCRALGQSGVTGSLFKMRLTSNGYTLVAKGVTKKFPAVLAIEESTYDTLKALQGELVPVYVGRLCLSHRRPLYYDGYTYTNLLLLSWSGMPLTKLPPDFPRETLVSSIERALHRIHQLGVLHCDPHLRNILYDPRTGQIMMVDFGQAQERPRVALAHRCSNAPKRRRDAMGTSKEEDEFAKERSATVKAFSSYLSRLKHT